MEIRATLVIYFRIPFTKYGIGRLVGRNGVKSKIYLFKKQKDGSYTRV